MTDTSIRKVKVLVPGPDGLSAYEIAVKHGYPGTEEEWLESFKSATAVEGETSNGMVQGFIAKHPTLPDTHIELFGVREDGRLTDYSIGNVEERLIDRGNIGSGGGAVDSVNGQTGAVVLDAADVGALPDDTVISGGSVDLFEPHTWPSFNSTGNEWVANTYDAYISGIDAKLATEITAGDVVKTSVGTSGAHTVYTYHVGPDHAPHVLLIGGTHGYERTASFAAMRFFTELALGNSAALAALRERVQVTWIPHLNAYGYSPQSRSNQNNVDPNRNYAFMWDYYVPSGDVVSKGTAPFSEPETQIVKALLDTTKISAVIDCHTGGGSNPDMCWSLPEGYAISQAQLANAAGARWNQAYNTDNNSFGEFFYDYDDPVARPSSANWMAKYLLWHLGRYNVAVVTAECDVASTDGVTAGPSATWLSAKMARLYCGYLHHLIGMWATEGQSLVAIPGHSHVAASTATQAVTTTETPVTLQVQPHDETGTTRAWVDLPLRVPGRFTAEVSLQLQANAAQTTAGRVRVRIGWDRSPVAGGNLTPLNDTTVGYVDLPTAGGYATYHRTYRLPPPFAITDDNPLIRFQVFVMRTAGDANPNVLGATVTITEHPDHILDRHAVAERTS